MAPVAADSAPGAGEESARGAEVFGSFSATRIESEKRNRAPLYLGMAAVLVVGGILAVVLARKNPAVEPAPGAGNSFPRPERGVAVPAEGHEHVRGNTHSNSHGSALQGSDRAGAPHLNVRRVAQIIDPQIRR